MGLLPVESMLRRMVRYDSVYPHEARIARFLARELGKCGFRVHFHRWGKGRLNVYAERGRGKRALLYYGHLDTVPRCEGWRGDPWKLRVAGDRLYGLGSSDMKGAIAAFLCALGKMRGPYTKVLICSDEEFISQGAWTFARSKKGREWFKDVGLFLSGERGISAVHPDGGPDVITLGRRGRCVIDLEVRGRSSHGASGNGINALVEASRVILALPRLSMRSHRLLPKESVFARKVSNQLSSLSVPDLATVEVDVHFVPPSTPKRIEARVRRFVKRLERDGTVTRGTHLRAALRKRPTPWLEPYTISPDLPEVLKLRKVLGSPSINYADSVGDENVLAKAFPRVPIVLIGPRAHGSHEANEWVSRRGLLELERAYQVVLASS